MAGPSPWNRKTKARNDAKKKASLGRTASERGLAKSVAASGRKVSRTNLGKPPTPSPKPPKGPRARRNPLATPPVQSAVERLRKRYTPSSGGAEEALGRDRSRTTIQENRLDDLAAKSVENPGLSRIENIARQNSARQNTALSSDGKTVKKFQGKGIVGKPSTGSVARAAKQGQLRGKKKLTTPEVRQTKRQVRKARRQVQKARAQVARGGMPANVPPEYAKWIRKYSPRIDKQARATYGLSGNEFMAKMLQGESGFDMSKVGPNTPYGNARGAAQFIPPTRDSFVEKFGIDPWRSPKEAVQAMALHLDGKSYSKTFGIQGYNPGINDSYYLNQDVGPTTQAAPNARRKLEQAKEQAGEVAERAANLGLSVQGIATPKQLKAMGIKPSRVLKQPTLWAQPKKPKGKPQVTWLNGTTPDQINPDIIALARTISRTTGLEIQITSALRPESSGSNHQVGGALDINAVADGGEGERKGDAIAYAAVIAAGGSEEDAQALASGAVGYVGFVSPNGQPVEFLWKGDADHRDHVHIAVESGQARGEKVFRGRTAVDQGALSEGFPNPTGGSYPTSGGGTSTTSGGVASGPAGRKRRQATILDRLRRPEVAAALRDMGFRVTADGVFRADGQNLSKTEFDKMKKRMGIE